MLASNAPVESCLALCPSPPRKASKAPPSPGFEVSRWLLISSPWLCLRLKLRLAELPGAVPKPAKKGSKAPPALGLERAREVWQAS